LHCAGHARAVAVDLDGASAAAARRARSVGRSRSRPEPASPWVWRHARSAASTTSARKPTAVNGAVAGGSTGQGAGPPGVLRGDGASGNAARGRSHAAHAGIPWSTTTMVAGRRGRRPGPGGERGGCGGGPDGRREGPARARGPRPRWCRRGATGPTSRLGPRRRRRTSPPPRHRSPFAANLPRRGDHLRPGRGRPWGDRRR
jgi:hypothetical protein